MEDSLKKVLSKIFEMEEEEISGDLSPENVVLWDSLHHLKLVTEIEGVFRIKLTMKEIRSMTSAGKIEELVRAHLDGERIPEIQQYTEGSS